MPSGPVSCNFSSLELSGYLTVMVLSNSNSYYNDVKLCLKIVAKNIKLEKKYGNFHLLLMATLLPHLVYLVQLEKSKDCLCLEKCT